MNFIDATILIVMALFVLGGWAKGFVREVGSLVAFFASLWIAGMFFMQASGPLKPFFAGWPAGGELASYVAGYIAVFVICQIIFGLLIVIVDGLIRLASFIPFLKMINRSGGALVGLIEGALVVSLVIFILAKFPFSPDLSKGLKESTFAEPTQYITAIFEPFMPDTAQMMPSIFDLNTLPERAMTFEQWQKMMEEVK